MDIFNILCGLITIFSLLFGFYEGKKNRNDVKEIKEAIAAPNDHKLKLAVSYYEAGESREALKIFKYFAENSESNPKDLFEVIKTIFWLETKSVFTKEYEVGLTPEVIIVLAIRRENVYTGKYSDFLIQLLDIYEEGFNKQASCYKAVVFIANKDFKGQCSNDLTKNLRLILGDNSNQTNELFKECIKSYCQSQDCL